MMNNFKHTILRALKNQHVFEKMVWTNEGELTRSMHDLFRTYNPSVISNGIICPLWKTPKKDLFTERDRRSKKSLQTIKKWPPKKLDDFMNQIGALLTKADLGNEWRLPFVTLILQGWFFPPIFNLNIECIGEKNKQRVLLELNPDTSSDDIKSAWGTIEKRRDNLWPNFKKTNLGKKSFKNLRIFTQDLEERFLKGDERDSNTGKPYKKKDSDIVGTLWPDEPDVSVRADKKRVANLRQIRHRR